MVKILISGALGRMGRKVFEACQSEEGVTVVCGVDQFESNELSFPVVKSFCDVKGDLKPDVIIDFSSPLALDGILNYALENETAVVLCATGYDQTAIDKIKDASSKIAVFRSANMSLGANVLIELVKNACKNLYGFDIEIIEKHHNQKVDSPSGTALMIADAVKEVFPDDYYVYGREGKVGKRNAKEIGIHAVRGGNIVGEHDCIFAGLNETVTLSHTATDRSVFAIGAVKAAKYVADKGAGAYDMKKLISDNLDA